MQVGKVAAGLTHSAYFDGHFRHHLACTNRILCVHSLSRARSIIVNASRSLSEYSFVDFSGLPIQM